MERTIDEFRQNNRKLTEIKAKFSQVFGSAKRYFYLYGENFEKAKNIDNGIGTENFWELLTQHFKGEIRLAASCEMQMLPNKIHFSAIDLRHSKLKDL